MEVRCDPNYLEEVVTILYKIGLLFRVKIKLVEVEKINGVYYSIHTLYNKMDRQMKTVKEAIEEKDLQRAHRNLINLADNNEELMQEIRWIKKGTTV